MAVELAPHQLEAVRNIHNGSLLKGGVGSGKSRVALTYFFTKECDGRLKVNGKGENVWPTKPKNLYVITTGKKRDDKDWHKEASKFGISTGDIGQLDGIKLTVDSWNNIAKYTEVENAFFIFDEQRLVGSGAWVKAFYTIATRNRWIVLSATPGDTWIDFIPIFVANGYFKNRTDFIRKHVVYNNFTKFPKVDRYVATGDLETLRRRVLVDMPYRRHTHRHVNNVPVSFSRVSYDLVVRQRWHIYEDRPLKDVGEMFIVMRKLVNSDPSRLGATMELMEKHPKLIIFYNFNYELDMLRTLMNTLSCPYSEWNGHKHEELIDGDRWTYLVQYTAGAEGWNCISTDATLFFSLNYSWKLLEQAKGRIDRMDTPYVDLYYYLLRSMSPIDNGITKALAGKKNFNEGAFLRNGA